MFIVIIEEKAIDAYKWLNWAESNSLWSQKYRVVAPIPSKEQRNRNNHGKEQYAATYTASGAVVANIDWNESYGNFVDELDVLLVFAGRNFSNGFFPNCLRVCAVRVNGFRC